MSDLTDSVEIAAEPAAVYALISDLPRMGWWSPECTGVTWRGPGRRPEEGARFIGHNRRGKVCWSTSGEVVTAAPGRAFAFEITVGPVKVARWEYTVDATERGCTVTERWTDRRPGWARRLLDSAMGSREQANIRGMRATLEALRDEAEALRREAERAADPI